MSVVNLNLTNTLFLMGLFFSTGLTPQWVLGMSSAPPSEPNQVSPIKQSRLGKARKKLLAKRVTHLPTGQLLSFFDSQKKQRVLTDKEKDLFFILKFSEEFGKKQSFTLTGEKSLPIATLVSHWAVYTATTDLEKTWVWDRDLSKIQKQKLRHYQKPMSQVFGPRGYLWAWFLAKTDQPEKAAKVLRELFDEAYQIGMNKKSHGFSRNNPMTKVTTYFEALQSLINPEELTRLRDKVQKLKVHLSNLPDRRILTDSFYGLPRPTQQFNLNPLLPPLS